MKPMRMGTKETRMQDCVQEQEAEVKQEEPRATSRKFPQCVLPWLDRALGNSLKTTDASTSVAEGNLQRPVSDTAKVLQVSTGKGFPPAVTPIRWPFLFQHVG